jgi:DEAD/DEAH box helicase domain-containing protein
MSNPTRLFEDLRDMYLRYLESPFDLRYEDLVAERRQLLDADGRIYRLPLIEPVPTYRSSLQSFAQAAPSLLSGWSATVVAEVIEFISLGLFPPELLMHQHQYDVFQEVVANSRDAVVTTGTGSGKTESFMLPIVATIMRESAQWAPSGARPAQWDWWNPVYSAPV